MPPPLAPPSAAGDDRLAAVYQLKIHLARYQSQICRRVRVQGDTTLAELHPIFQVARGRENGYPHHFKLWGREYGTPYAGGIYFSDDTHRIHPGDFPWRTGDTFTYDFGDYWHHQVRVEKLLPPTTLSAHQFA